MVFSIINSRLITFILRQHTHRIIQTTVIKDFYDTKSYQTAVFSIKKSPKIISFFIP